MPAEHTDKAYMRKYKKADMESKETRDTPKEKGLSDGEYQNVQVDSGSPCASDQMKKGR